MEKIEFEGKGRFEYAVIAKDTLYAVRANSKDEAADFIHHEKGVTFVHVAPFMKIMAKIWTV